MLFEGDTKYMCYFYQHWVVPSYYTTTLIIITVTVIMIVTMSFKSLNSFVKSLDLIITSSLFIHTNRLQ